MYLNNFTLLYVEDDFVAQELIQELFKDQIKEFYQAYNGQEGLEIYKEKKPDIILTDINMPILDGLKMSKEIKQIDKKQPIVIMSAFDDKKILLEAINMSIDYFTPKPIDIELLTDRLQTIAKHLQNEIDIETARKREIENLYNLAHYDTLTNIPNRFLFNLELDKLISKEQRTDGEFSLFFIDLDNFKTINDTFGHTAGDIVLKTVSQNIKDVIRIEDTFARISGDEFSLIIEDTIDKENINILAQKILDAAAKPIKLDDTKTVNISCSIGISRFPIDATNKKDLLHNADSAMYKAKANGKHSYSYFKE